MLDASHIATPSTEVHDHFVRRRCRNLRCQGKLKRPTTDARAAFCSIDCFESYYRRCCIVCERALPRLKASRPQRFCRQKCKSAYHRDPARFLGRWGETPAAVRKGSRNPHSTGTTRTKKHGPTLRKVAGPDLHSINLMIPLDPGLVARAQRANGSHRIGPKDWPVDLVGGHRRSKTRSKLFAHAINIEMNGDVP
jgi:hypothetical protein